MHSPTVRLLAFVVLALFGAPVAIHVVMHDLQGPHEEAPEASGAKAGHSDHEHPIVFASAPGLPTVTCAALPATIPATTPATWSRVAAGDRNVLSLGALRMDDDIGLQALLSTFLI